mmetsp:Transcript_90480/g.180045  ORF Transcript_90480/g.180045 Transcript_90480/m.180045 type:complete len:288 (-) Transcript_90480:658-1521(-)
MLPQSVSAPLCCSQNEPQVSHSRCHSPRRCRPSRPHCHRDNAHGGEHGGARLGGQLETPPRVFSSVFVTGPTACPGPHPIVVLQVAAAPLTVSHVVIDAAALVGAARAAAFAAAYVAASLEAACAGFAASLAIAASAETEVAASSECVGPHCPAATAAFAELVAACAFAAGLSSDANHRVHVQDPAQALRVRFGPRHVRAATGPQDAPFSVLPGATSSDARPSAPAQPSLRTLSSGSPSPLQLQAFLHLGPFGLVSPLLFSSATFSVLLPSSVDAPLRQPQPRASQL